MCQLLLTKGTQKTQFCQTKRKLILARIFILKIVLKNSSYAIPLLKMLRLIWRLGMLMLWPMEPLKISIFLRSRDRSILVMPGEGLIWLSINFISIRGWKEKRKRRRKRSGLLSIFEKFRNLLSIFLRSKKMRMMIQTSRIESLLSSIRMTQLSL